MTSCSHPTAIDAVTPSLLKPEQYLLKPEQYQHYLARSLLVPYRDRGGRGTVPSAKLSKMSSLGSGVGPLIDLVGSFATHLWTSALNRPSVDRDSLDRTGVSVYIANKPLHLQREPSLLSRGRVVRLTGYDPFTVRRP